MLLGALRKPNLWPRVCLAAVPPRISPRQTPSTKAIEARTAERSRLASRIGAAPSDIQEVEVWAMQHDANVEELLTVGSRHAAQDDVLIGEAGHDRPLGSHSRVANRASRKAT